MPGRPGLEGPRGDPAVLPLNSTKPEKGDKGDRGEMGRIGPKGKQTLLPSSMVLDEYFLIVLIMKICLTFFQEMMASEDRQATQESKVKLKGTINDYYYLF